MSQCALRLWTVIRYWSVSSFTYASMFGQLAYSLVVCINIEDHLSLALSITHFFFFQCLKKEKRISQSKFAFQSQGQDQWLETCAFGFFNLFYFALLCFALLCSEFRTRFCCDFKVENQILVQEQVSCLEIPIHNSISQKNVDCLFFFNKQCRERQSIKLW